MTAKPTPGPWAWRGKSGSLHRVANDRFMVYGGAVLYPSYEYESGVDTVVSDADAALIAAAPDLLAALKGVLRVADRKTIEFGAARAAIAKAEGNNPSDQTTALPAIGEEFSCGGRQWLCTDVGTRTIIAICLDEVEVGGPDLKFRKVLNREEAETEGWFNGPPYAVAEYVFDENDQEAINDGE